MQIRSRKAKEKEVLQVMQLRSTLRNGQVLNCILEVTTEVKAIFKCIPGLTKQIRICPIAEIKLLSCWKQEDDLREAKVMLYSDVVQ